MLKGVSLYLVGMMGSGKSTVGRLLAEKLGYGFVDLDALIEQVSGKRVGEIFERAGEAVFRDLESRVLAEVSAYTRLVVATGGGAVLTQRNWGYLHHGVVVWLDADIETLLGRLEHEPGTRPLLGGGDRRRRLVELLGERTRLYAQADVRVSAAGLPPEVAEETLRCLAARLVEDSAP
ncbi:MAG: shikimate kinase [Aphanocapsa lilacina HA4352-LM1]|jgi:shikimate kinase|nr:shikimate kinase [Aphanocapsa lilacina HA4352-LM1]